MPGAYLEATLSLLRAAQTGDMEATNELLARYRPRVHQIVALLIGKQRADMLEQEEDIVQETLIDAFHDLRGFEPRSEGALLHWLSRLAANNVRDAVRRERAVKRGEGRVKPIASMPTDFLVSSAFKGRDPTPSQIAASKEIRDQIEKAILTLSERHRRAFILRNMCDASYEAIAEELELGSASSARALFSRALAELSAQLP